MSSTYLFSQEARPPLLLHRLSESLLLVMPPYFQLVFYLDANCMYVQSAIHMYYVFKLLRFKIYMLGKTSFSFSTPVLSISIAIIFFLQLPLGKLLQHFHLMILSNIFIDRELRHSLILIHPPL